MHPLLRKACALADTQGFNHVAAVDCTGQGGSLYFYVSMTRTPLIKWAKTYERKSAAIYLADKLSNGWEAY